MEHKMTTVDEAKVEYFINAYGELNRSLQLVETDLKLLDTEKTKILDKFTLVRTQDDEFKKSLETKYGKGTINPGNYTFITIED